MIQEDIHVGDIGTVFTLTIKDEDGSPVDLSSATIKQILFKSPKTKTLLTKAATFVTSGSDGKIQYETIDGDLDESGLWKIQGYIESPSWTGHTSKEDFVVYPNL